MTDLVDSSSRLKTRVSTPDESLRITTKRPTGRHGKLEESSWMHWCTEQMIAGYKRNPAEEPTDQNRGNLLGEPIGKCKRKTE